MFPLMFLVFLGGSVTSSASGDGNALIQIRNDGTCKQASNLSGTCVTRLTNAEGCKTGKTSKCVLCSACTYYKGSSQAIQNYLTDYPGCRKCKKMGARLAIRDEADFTTGDVSNKWNCMQKSSDGNIYMPASCKPQCDYADSSDKSACKRFYYKRVLEEEEPEEGL